MTFGIRLVLLSEKCLYFVYISRLGILGGTEVFFIAPLAHAIEILTVSIKTYMTEKLRLLPKTLINMC